MRHHVDRLSDLAISDAVQHFEYFAPRWERSVAAPLVVVHRSHEFDFKTRVVSFTSCGVDLSASLVLTSRFVVSLLLFNFDVNLLYLVSSSCCSTRVATAINNDFRFN